jgi:hypothetical protein
MFNYIYIVNSISYFKRIKSLLLLNFLLNFILTLISNIMESKTEDGRILTGGLHIKKMNRLVDLNSNIQQLIILYLD